MTRALAPAAKRAIDVAGSLLLLVVLSPVLLAIAAAIRLGTPGPALFRQRREGRDARPFLIWKFRTMTAGAEGTGTVRSMDDPRVTRLGRLLRRTSLDELPQLLNVLRGEMSLVGPRPLLPGTTRPDERLRLGMRPGMTGLVEVRQPHLLSWDERMQVDLEYVDRWSLGLDLLIVARTIPALIGRRDVLDLPREETAPEPGGTG